MAEDNGVIPDKEKTGRERSNENLKPWGPGESGNPAGRPVGSKNGIRSRLFKMLDEEVCESIVEKLEEGGIKLSDNNKAEAIAQVLGRAAINGDLKAISIIAEQTEVPLPKALEHTGPGGGPIQGTWTVKVVKPEKGEIESDDGSND